MLNEFYFILNGIKFSSLKKAERFAVNSAWMYHKSYLITDTMGNKWRMVGYSKFRDAVVSYSYKDEVTDIYCDMLSVKPTYWLR